MKLLSLIQSTALVLAATISSCDKSDQNVVSQDLISLDEQPALKSQHQGPEFVPNEMIIKFKEGVTTEARNAALLKINGQVSERIHTSAMKDHGDKMGILLVTVPVRSLDAISKAKDLPEIEYAEPNYIYQHDATSNDTYYTNGSLWGMYGGSTSPNNDFGSHAGEEWAAGKTGSSNVWIGIIDEGYMYTHEDLAANAGKVPGEIAGNGIDDDGNGYVDDVYGWDFDGNNNTVFDGVNDDHGTHVAGTIGAAGGNGKGVAGVCWNVKLVNAKFLGQNGGTTANAIKAVDYITDLKTRHGLNLVATNNSWGGGGFSQGLQDAITRAGDAGILFIAAAGNSSANIDASASYPASYPNSNIISVASITSSGDISSFSNFGATQVDLGAPGSGIVSSVPKRSGNKIVSGYANYSGTSMSTPHVTGAAALYASTHPGATASEIKAAILGSAAATASLAGKCVTGGRLNVGGF